MYENFVQYVAPTLGTALGAIFTALAGYFIVYINSKKKALKEEIANENAEKYLDMITETIEDCVRATNQTYVEALKKQNAFTEEAQKEAFQKTLDNIRVILNEDCIKYLETITNDVNEYLTNRIESEVNWQK